MYAVLVRNVTANLRGGVCKFVGESRKESARVDVGV